MTLIHSLMDDSQIQNSQLRAFLHQRCREWRHSDLTNDPQQCTLLPEDYSSEGTPAAERVMEHISWNEDVPKTGPLSSITNALQRLAATVSPTSNKDESVAVAAVADTDIWSSGRAAICPTFAGGPETTGECILTNSAVQEAVLSFFEQVACEPQSYCNPKFKTFTAAPQPSPDNPLALDPDDPDVANFSSLPEEMTIEQAEVNYAREQLEHMKKSLKSCSSTTPELQDGCKKLVAKIANKEVEIEELVQQALAAGALPAGAEPEARQKRKNWKPKVEGVPVSIAGTTADSELMKLAGLTGTVEEALKGMDGEEGA